MQSALAFGRSLDKRLKRVIQVHDRELKKARESGDLEREKFVLEGCQYIDSLARGAYSMSQEIDTLPVAAAPLAHGAKQASGRIFESALRALEARTAKLEGASPMQYFKNSMGAIEPLAENQFYPPGESFDWYNPADWMRAAKYEAAQTVHQAVNVADDVSGAVAKNVALGLGIFLVAYAVKKQIDKQS